MSDGFDDLDATEKAGIGAALYRCRALAAKIANELRNKRPEHFVDRWSLADIHASLERNREIRAASCVQNPRHRTGQTIALRKGTERLRPNLEERLFDSIGPVPVVLTHPLDKQELTFGGRFIRNAVGGTRWNLKSFADREPVAVIRTPGLDGELTSQNEIMVRALAVIMPGNDIAIGQRKDTNLNVRADNDGLDAFHLVVRHLDVFRPNQGMFGISMVPMTRRENRQPALPAAARVWRAGRLRRIAEQRENSSRFN
jgi:hypothetical protein